MTVLLFKQNVNDSLLTSFFVFLLPFWINDRLLYAHPDIEVSIFITGADAEGVVGPRRDAGGLDLEDVRGHRALRGDAHVAVDDGKGKFSTCRLVDGTHATAKWTERERERER